MEALLVLHIGYPMAEMRLCVAGHTVSILLASRPIIEAAVNRRGVIRLHLGIVIDNHVTILEFFEPVIERALLPLRQLDAALLARQETKHLRRACELVIFAHLPVCRERSRPGLLAQASVP